MNKCIFLWCGTMLAVAGFAEPGPLSLEQALELARQNSPALRASRMHAQSIEKGMDAVGLRSNPKLEIEAEGLGWDNDLFSDGEYTVGVKQEFQLGGKRKKDRAVALNSKHAATQEIEERERDLSAKVRAAFVELMAQQETGTVRAEQQQLGEAFLRVAQRHLETGGGSELDVVQAELALEEIVLAQTCCFGDLAAAQEKLASLIGIPLAELGVLTAPYYTLTIPEVRGVDDSYPTLQRMAATAEMARAEALRAKAEDTPNVSLGAGYRYKAEEDANSFLFSASMPLNFNRKGRAEYAAGQLRAAAVDAEREELRRQLEEELATLLSLYSGAMAEVELTKTRLMPKAEQAFELTRDGYDLGRFSWLEMISTQQTLTDIRVRYIESLRDAHLAYAQITKFMKEGIEP